MKRLFFKSLHKSRRDYHVIISCGIFIISIIYITTFISDSMIQITTGERGTATEVYKNLGVFILTYVILGILMVLMTLSYIRKRSYEYAMFSILGMKKKHRYRFIGCEYGGIILSSMLGGLLIGRIVSIMVLPALRVILNDNSLGIHRNRMPLRLTIIVGMVIFALVFMICDELIACLGLDAVLSMGKGSGRNYHFSRLPFMIGSVFTVFSFSILFSYWGKVHKAIPATLASAGIFCIMTAVCGGWLETSRKKRDYYKKILWMDQWYHRFYYNVNISVIVAIFIFVNYFSFGIKICDHVPPLDNADYPYDLVWMGNEGDELFIQELEDTYGIGITKLPCVRVTTPDFGEHMGLSASEYEALTGAKQNLKDKEICVVYQRNREERNLLGIDYGGRRPRLYIGSARKDLWISTGMGLVPGNEFQRDYQLVSEENRMVTGVYQSRAVGDWRGNVWEQVIVFSDEYFEQVRRDAEGADLAVLINIPKDCKEEDYLHLKETLGAYAKEHSQINALDYRYGNLIYEKDIEMPRNRQGEVLKLSSAGINIFILMLCIIFILWIKGKCDYEDMRWKYEFYTCSGMEEKKKRRCIKKEMFLGVLVSLLGGVPVSVLFTVGDVLEKDMELEWNLKYMIEMLGLAGALILLVVGAQMIFTMRIVRKLEASE